MGDEVMINHNDVFREKGNKCKCCNGTGVQYNKNTGLTQHCPCCSGSGLNKKNPLGYIRG